MYGNTIRNSEDLALALIQELDREQATAGETAKRRAYDPTRAAPRSDPNFDPEVKALRAKLENINYILYQIQQDTGLTLLPIELYDEGYLYGDPVEAGPYEIVEDCPVPNLLDCNKSYSFFSYTHWDDRIHSENLLHRMNHDLHYIYLERQECLADFQETYRLSKFAKEHLYVYFGLQFIHVLMPLETAAKYRVISDGKTWRNCQIINSEYLYYIFHWNKFSLSDFDSLLCYFDYKAERYEKEDNLYHRFVMQRNRQLQWLNDWEKLHLVS